MQNTMSSWAIIKTGGKQYKVAEGDIVSVEKLKDTQAGKISLNNILAVNTEKGITIGKPLVANAKVTAKILETAKDKKVRVVKFKSKSRYTRTTGHRQTKTKILIEKIQI